MKSVNSKQYSVRRSVHGMIPICIAILITLLGASGGMPVQNAYALQDNPNPPEQVVKLIFIHHSTGENWLTDGYGDLGKTLGENNYFVSDTNYGWGPDAIGDRTDIVNWTEWFRGPDSQRYLAALYTESEQHSSYTRTLPDPGGENQIVMFKSCFPNSNLEGEPDDPPAAGDGLTVSNAKAIYNDLLKYFVTRPDKLFIVVTAPPVQDATYADNARAFNNWLMQDWLSENQYPLNNVAVFDFYNILTHPDNHHRFRDGSVEYINTHGNNTSRYPTDGGDDHPNPQGSRKATEEFVPLLNMFYHRWVSSSSVQLPAQPTVSGATPAAPTEAPASGEPQPPAVAPTTVDLIDDFEAGTPTGTPGWQGFWDEAVPTTIACAPESGIAHTGGSALHANFSVAANSWATCVLLYDQIQNWQSAQGISFYVHAAKPGMAFDALVYGGTPGALASYPSWLETTQEMVDGWVTVEIHWDALLRAEWEENAGTPFDPSQATGFGFGFDGGSDAPGVGEIWVDDVHLIGASAPVVEKTSVVANQPPAEQPTQAPEATALPEEEEDQGGGGGGPCRGSIGLGLLAAVSAIWAGKRNLTRK
jgi:hypothetical protein